MLSLKKRYQKKMNKKETKDKFNKHKMGTTNMVGINPK